MMLFATLALVVSAKPPPAPLPTISAPLGHFGGVVEAVPATPPSDLERMVRPAIDQCTPSGVYLMRFLGGAGRVLEQLQQWLDAAPGAEKKLFTRKAMLAEVMRQLSQARYEDRRACAPLTLGDGYRLELDVMPKKMCETPPPPSGLGEYWFFTGPRPAAVISVQQGDPDPCLMRVSAVLFDARGAARLRIHADWGSASSVTLIGDKCQKVDFVFHADTQTYVPEWKSCKR